MKNKQSEEMLSTQLEVRASKVSVVIKRFKCLSYRGTCSLSILSV